jgi:hypothetical protein
MNKKNIIGLTVSIILLVLAVVFYKGLFKSDNRPGENELGYYFDLNTRELFVKDGTMRPPVHAPSGADKDGRPAGVRAYVYSKTGGNANDIEIAFLEYEVPGGSMISAPDVIEWISATSVNGSKLRQSALKRCIEKGYTKRVYPRPR